MSAGNRPRSIARRSSSTVPRAAISRATTSRGASSSVNRLPWSSSRTAPSPRSASESSSDESTSVVGWNCTNSRSASAAPARYAAAIPSPIAPAGSSCAARARRRRRSTGASRGRDRTAVGDDADAALVVAPDRQHPLAFGDAIRGCASTRSASTRATRSPVAAPPACTTRLRLCPPSSPSPSSNSTPSSTRSRIRAGASSGQHRDRARAAEPAAGPKRVLGVQRRRVVLAHRGGDPALGEEAVRRRAAAPS